MSPPSVKAFISYSWTTVEHSDWVLSLAERLQLSGVEVVIDQWNLEPGHDVHAFMESMVTDPEIKYVLMLCDRAYASKADARRGGVGSEAQIISPELYTRTDQTKFIPIVLENDDEGNACLPAFLKSRYYIDFSTQQRAAEQFDTLLRTLFKAPRRPRPPLGAPPEFLTDARTGPIARMRVQYARLEVQLAQRPEQARPVLRDLLDAAFTELNGLRFSETGGGEDVFEFAKNMPEKATPVRNAVLESVVALAKAESPLSLGQILHEFLEKCILLFNPKPGQSSWNSLEFDPPRLIVLELFLGVVAIMVRYDRFGDLDFLLEEPYFYSQHSRPQRGSIDVFRTPLYLYDNELNRRLRAQKVSYSIELLKERAANSPVAFDELIYADFICFLRWALAPPDRGVGRWIPTSIIYLDYYPPPFDLFYRAASSERYFAKVCSLLKISSRAELAQRYDEAVRQHGIDNQQFHHNVLPYSRLLNLEELTKVK